MTLQVPTHLRLQIEILDKKRCVYDGIEFCQWGIKGQGSQKTACDRTCSQEHARIMRKIEEIISSLENSPFIFGKTKHLSEKELSASLSSFVAFAIKAIAAGYPSKTIFENLKAVWQGKSQALQQSSLLYQNYYETWSKIR